MARLKMEEIVCEVDGHEREAEVMWYDGACVALTGDIQSKPKFLVSSKYKEIAEKFLSSKKNYTVLAETGTGKSSLLLYIAYRLVTAGEKVLIEAEYGLQGSRNRLMVCLDSIEDEEVQARVGTWVDFRKEIQHPSTYLLVDGLPPEFHTLARCFLACTPEQKDPKWLRSSDTLKMGEWTREETLVANEAIYKLHRHVFEQRYDEWGGYPASLFGSTRKFARDLGELRKEKEGEGAKADKGRFNARRRMARKYNERCNDLQRKHERETSFNSKWGIT